MIDTLPQGRDHYQETGRDHCLENGHYRKGCLPETGQGREKDLHQLLTEVDSVINLTTLKTVFLTEVGHPLLQVLFLVQFFQGIGDVAMC